MLARVNTALQTSIRAMNATADALGEQGEAQQSSMVALNASMQTRLEAAVNATRSLGSDTIYTHWGSKVCTAPNGFTVVKHYDGMTWGAHHGTGTRTPPHRLPPVAGLSVAHHWSRQYTTTSGASASVVHLRPAENNVCAWDRGPCQHKHA